MLKLVLALLVIAAPVKLDELPPPLAQPPPDGPVLSLQEALAAAKTESPDLEVMRARVDQAQISLRKTWRQLVPTLTAGLTYTRNAEGATLPGLDGGTLNTVEVNNVQGNVTLAASLFNGRVFPALATARQQVDVARLTAAQVSRELLLNVAASYLTGAGLRQLAIVSLRQAQSTREHARDAAVRYEAGVVQRSAALRARIDALKADEEVRRAQVQYAESKSQLAQLLDRRDTAFELAEPPEPAAEVSGAFAELLQKALADRPEMAIARANEQIALRLKDDAWAQFLPSLSANAALRYNNASTLFSSQTTTWAITLALTIPLYDGGLRYESLKDADAKTREAKAQTRSQASKVEDEVRRGRLELESARALFNEARQQVELARENHGLITAQFAAGTATQVEVSDAVTALQQAEATVVQDKLNVQLAGLRVLRAVGAFDP